MSFGQHRREAEAANRRKAIEDFDQFCGRQKARFKDRLQRRVDVTQDARRQSHAEDDGGLELIETRRGV